MATRRQVSRDRSVRRIGHKRAAPSVLFICGSAEPHEPQTWRASCGRRRRQANGDGWPRPRRDQDFVVRVAVRRGPDYSSLPSLDGAIRLVTTRSGDSCPPTWDVPFQNRDALSGAENAGRSNRSVCTRTRTGPLNTVSEFWIGRGPESGRGHLAKTVLDAVGGGKFYEEWCEFYTKSPKRDQRESFRSYLPSLRFQDPGHGL